MSQIDRVHPSLRGVLKNLGTQEELLSDCDIDEVRKNSEKRLARKPVFGSVQPEKISINTLRGSLNLYVFSLAQTHAPPPCLLWFYGAGYVMGQARDMWCRLLFYQSSNCVVILVEYGFAQENRAPAVLYDGYSALNWVRDNAKRLNINPERIAVGGASTGGGLAAGLAMYRRDNCGPSICFQLLLYLMIDNRQDTPSGRLKDHPVWPLDHSLACWHMYLGPNASDQIIQYVSVLRAVDLQNLPQAYICVNDVDLFHGECVDCHQMLVAFGVESIFSIICWRFLRCQSQWL